jgi:hypothetical protein
MSVLAAAVASAGALALIAAGPAAASPAVPTAHATATHEASSASSRSDACDYRWSVKGNGVRLHSEPWVSSSVRGLGYNDDALTIYSFNGDWDYVRDAPRGVTGWISTAYVQGYAWCD